MMDAASVGFTAHPRVGEIVEVGPAVAWGRLDDGRWWYLDLSGGVASLGIGDNEAGARINCHRSLGGVLSVVYGTGVHEWPDLHRRGAVFAELLNRWLAAEPGAPPVLRTHTERIEDELAQRRSVLRYVANTPDRTVSEVARGLHGPLQAMDVRGILDLAHTLGYVESKARPGGPGTTVVWSLTAEGRAFLERLEAAQ